MQPALYSAFELRYCLDDFSSMYLMTSPTVCSFSASSSGTSTPNSSSNAITSSTISSESAPKSSMKDACGVTCSGFTPSCSTMMSLTFSSIDLSDIKSGWLGWLRIRGDWIRAHPGLCNNEFGHFSLSRNMRNAARLHFPRNPITTRPMSDLPEDLDLKFLPDWLKEAPATNRYANFQGEPEGRGRDRD